MLATLFCGRARVRVLWLGFFFVIHGIGWRVCTGTTRLAPDTVVTQSPAKVHDVNFYPIFKISFECGQRGCQSVARDRHRKSSAPFAEDDSL